MTLPAGAIFRVSLTAGMIGYTAARASKPMLGLGLDLLFPWLFVLTLWIKHWRN